METEFLKIKVISKTVQLHESIIIESGILQPLEFTDSEYLKTSSIYFASELKKLICKNYSIAEAAKAIKTRHEHKQYKAMTADYGRQKRIDTFFYSRLKSKSY